MINPNLTYPGLVSTPDANYPYGGAINESSSGALDGTPLEQKWVNDFLGMSQRSITISNIVPSNTAETAADGGSQIIQALAAMMLPKEFTHIDNGSTINTYVAVHLNPTPEIDPNSLFNGLQITFNLPAGLANNAAATFSLDGSPADAIVDQSGAVLTGGEIQPGKIKLQRDQALTRWILLAEDPGVIPIGGTLIWDSPGSPGPQYVKKDGQAISRITYAKYFAVVGTFYGIGDGSTTFNVPKDNGLIYRIKDDGAGVDPDAGARTVPAGGTGSGGDEMGTEQAGQNELHGHPTRVSPNAGSVSDTTGGMMIDAGSDANFPAHTGSPAPPAGDQVGGSGGSEARMINKYVGAYVRVS